MSRYSDDYEDEAPSPRRSSSTAADTDTKTAFSGGWGTAKKQRQADRANSKFADSWAPSKDDVIVKFLDDDGPYITYRRHWVERGEGKQKSFVCIADTDPKGCPLCDIGDRSAAQYAFNIVVMESGTDPVLKSYQVGTRNFDALENFHSNPRTGPLTNGYWAVNRTGKGNASQTRFLPVSENDLGRMWDLDPLTEDQLDSFRKAKYEASILQVPSRNDLLTIVAEISDDDD
jgi:hypothetical protein